MKLLDLKQKLEECSQDPHEFFQNNDINKLKTLTHPDRWVDDSSQAQELFKEFVLLYEQSLNVNYIHDYRIIREYAVGEFSTLHLCKKDGLEYLIKTPRHPKPKPLIKKEFDGYKIFNSSTVKLADFYYPVPELNGNNLIFGRKWPMVTLSEYANKRNHIIDDRHIVWITKRILIALGIIHDSGYAHGAVTPDHILIDEANHGGTLCGLIHYGKIGSKIDFVPLKWKHYYPPETRTSKAYSKFNDIWMLSIAMLEMFPNMRKEFRGFFKSQLLHSTLCEQNVFKLHNEIRQIAFNLYGPPKFVS